MRRSGQCETCLRWVRSGGSVLPAVEGCGWIDDPGIRALPVAVALLMPVLARIAAREGVCPGHLVFDAISMPDAYRSQDLEAAVAEPSGLEGAGAGAILRTATETGKPS
jgi:hypothetical protein